MCCFLNQSDIYSSKKIDGASEEEKSVTSTKSLWWKMIISTVLFFRIPSSFLISNGDDAKSGKGVIFDDFYERDLSFSLSLTHSREIDCCILICVELWNKRSFSLFHSTGRLGLNYREIMEMTTMVRDIIHGAMRGAASVGIVLRWGYLLVILIRKLIW